VVDVVVADFRLSATQPVVVKEAVMPYGIRKGGEDCPFEVYKTQDDSRAPGGCHPTREKALAHQRALSRNVPEATTNEGLEPEPGEHFHAIAHTEGQSTGMRTFTNLSWREPPFAFHWQKGAKAHGGTPITVEVGLVTRALRDPGDDAVIHMFGPLDLEAVDGREYGRRLTAGFARWVSIGLDETPVNVEYEWPEGHDEENPLAGLFEQPEQMTFDGGVIGELTGVSVPAQADATIEPTPELVEALGGEVAAMDDAESAAMAENECPEGQRWDDELQDCVPAESAAGDGFYAAQTPNTQEREKGAKEGWAMDDGSFPIRDCRDVEKAVHAMNRPTNKSTEAIHRHIVKRANALGCTSHLPSTWPSSTKKSTAGEGFKPFVKGGGKAGPGDKVPDSECPDGEVWDTEAGKCVPASAGVIRIHHGTTGTRVERTVVRPPEPSMADVVQAITAAAYRIEIPELPPAGWFEEPTDVTIPGAFCVTDEGRIYGILAPLKTNHRAYASAGRKLFVPNRQVDYDRFLGGEALTDQGRIHNVGPVTMDCGHASRYRADGDVGFAHYDNACTVVGKVRVGETAEGLPWVAGALEPGVTPDQVSRMLACRLSGDWQPHSDRPGWDELVACLLVPSPGFPMGRTGPTITKNREALVASSMPVRFVDSGLEHFTPDEARAAITAAAAGAGRGEWARLARRWNRRRHPAAGRRD
jgi:hypothetical protein